MLSGWKWYHLSVSLPKQMSRFKSAISIYG
jgi:hypothetical protein